TRRRDRPPWPIPESELEAGDNSGSALLAAASRETSTQGGFRLNRVLETFAQAPHVSGQLLPCPAADDERTEVSLGRKAARFAWDRSALDYTHAFRAKGEWRS